MLQKSYDRLVKHIIIKVRNKAANFLTNISMVLNNVYYYNGYASIQYTTVCLQRNTKTMLFSVDRESHVEIPRCHLHSYNTD